MEYNYIEFKNQFWKLRRSKRITNLQADLYDFIIHESSSRGIGTNWENPFQCSNGTICSAIGVGEKALINARNVLQQLGLIEFEAGVTKQKSPVYSLLHYWLKESNPASIAGSKKGSNTVSNAGSKTGNTIKEETKHKLNQNETEGNGAAVPPTPSFKNWTELEFKNAVMSFAESFPHELRNTFFKYWKEKSASGKMRFQLEKTWETDLRLETWVKRQNEFTPKKSNINGLNPINVTSASKSAPGRTIEFDNP